MRFAGTQLSNFMGDTTDFSLIAGTSSNGRRMERQAAMRGEGLVASSGIQGIGKVKSSEFQADAIEAQGAAQGQASVASGIGNMVSGFASGIGYKNLYGGKGGGAASAGSITPSIGTSTNYFNGGFTPMNYFS